MSTSQQKSTDREITKSVNKTENIQHGYNKIRINRPQEITTGKNMTRSEGPKISTPKNQKLANGFKSMCQIPISPSASSVTTSKSQFSGLNSYSTSSGGSSSLQRKKKAWKKPKMKTYLCDEKTGRYNLVKIYRLDIPADPIMAPKSQSDPACVSSNEDYVAFDANGMANTESQVNADDEEDEFDFLTSIKNPVIEQEKREAAKLLRQQKQKRLAEKKRREEAEKSAERLNRLTKPKSSPSAHEKGTSDLGNVKQTESLLDRLLGKPEHKKERSSDEDDDEKAKYMFLLNDGGSLETRIGGTNSLPLDRYRRRGYGDMIPSEDRYCGDDPDLWNSTSDYRDRFGLYSRYEKRHRSDPAEFVAPLVNQTLYSKDKSLFYQKNDSGIYTHGKEEKATLRRSKSDSDLLACRYSFLTSKHSTRPCDGEQPVQKFSLGEMITDSNLNIFKLKELANEKKPMLKQFGSESNLFQLKILDELDPSRKAVPGFSMLERDLESALLSHKSQHERTDSNSTKKKLQRMNSLLDTQPKTVKLKRKKTDFVKRNIEMIAALARAKKKKRNDLSNKHNHNDIYAPESQFSSPSISLHQIVRQDSDGTLLSDEGEEGDLFVVKRIGARSVSPHLKHRADHVIEQEYNAVYQLSRDDLMPIFGNGIGSNGLRNKIPRSVQGYAKPRSRQEYSTNTKKLSPLTTSERLVLPHIPAISQDLSSLTIRPSVLRSAGIRGLQALRRAKQDNNSIR